MATVLGANSVTGGYEVENSVRLDGYDSSSRMEYTASNASNRRTWTWSAWIKRSDKRTNNFQVLFSSTPTGPAERIMFEGDKLTYDHDKAGTDFSVSTPGVLRDLGAWYHVVVMKDTTQSTETNRIKIYVNGVQQTLAEVQEGFPGQNLESTINTAAETQLFAQGDGEEFGGYACEVVFCDGQSLAADQFGEFDEDSGIWKPIDVSGLTFGNEGFYLDFQTSAELGDDVSGNTNDFTESNLNAVHQSTDTCTNNFSTFNGVLKQMSTMALTEGNLQGATSSSHEAFFGSFFSSIGVTTGKWYAEFKCTGNANQVYVGISSNLEDDVHGSTTVGGVKAFTFAYKGNGWAYYGADGKIAHTNSDTFLSYGAALSNNDIVGVALDLDELEIYFSINGSFQNSGDPTSGSSQTGGVVTAGAAALTTGANSGTYYFCVSDNDQSTVCTVQANFGSPIHSISSGNADGNGFGNFEYAVPSGYLALCTKNLAESG